MSRFKIIALGLLLAFAGCDNNTETKNTPKKTPSLLEEGPKVCATLKEEACIAHKDCTFVNKTCTEATKKNACENIQSPEACNEDKSCGGWDPATKKCLEKQAAADEKVVKLFNIEHVGSMGNNQIDSLTVSDNQEWAYFVSNDHKNLTAFNIESPAKLKANLSDDTKWHTLALKLGDDAGNTAVLHQAATQKGALISLGGADNKRGVALLEGKSFVASWKNDNMQSFWGIAMSKRTGEQYVSIFASTTDKFMGNTNNVNINKLTNSSDAQVNLDLVIERETNAFTRVPHSAPGYLVDNAGIVLVSDDQVGASAKFAAIDAKTPDLGSDNWKFLGSEDANNDVSSVALVKNILFIGLKSGGVAVYDSKADATKRAIQPHDVWAKTPVIALAPDKHGSVWAVTPNALIEVKVSKKSVKQGQKIDADEILRSAFTGDHEKDKTPGFKFNKAMALETITGAYWIGDHLIITSKNGIHVWLYELKVSK